MLAYPHLALLRRSGRQERDELALAAYTTCVPATGWEMPNGNIASMTGTPVVLQTDWSNITEICTLNSCSRSDTRERRRATLSASVPVIVSKSGCRSAMLP